MGYSGRLSVGQKNKIHSGGDTFFFCIPYAEEVILMVPEFREPWNGPWLFRMAARDGTVDEFLVGN
jgi:hypothetical protein